MVDQNVGMNIEQAGGFYENLEFFGIVHSSMTMKWSYSQLDLIQSLFVERQMWVLS
jgi:hypothetical protein